MKCLRRLPLLISCGLPGLCCGAEPVLTHIHPAGMQCGTAVKVELAGSFNPWPVQLHADVPGITFTAGKDPGTGEITVAPDVPSGPHLLRAVNDEGASAPVAIVISTAVQTPDVEPNDDPKAPQQTQGAVCSINGRLDKRGDVDGFRIGLTKGQQLVARSECFVLASPVDLMLRITDAAGNLLAFNHDHTTMDPFLVFTAPADGDYVIQVMGHKYPASTEIDFTGGKDCLYRLQLSAGPVIRNCWPLAATRGSSTALMLEGWNLSETFREIDPASAHGLPILITGMPELIACADPQPVRIPGGISGRMEKPGDEDRFTFDAAKGTALELRVASSSLDSSMDPVLRIAGADGKELATDDDGGGFGEALLKWSAPADGTYTALITDRAQRGGPDFYYHLAIASPQPGLSATLAAHSARVDAGKSTELKVKLTRTGGFSSPLKLIAKGLPAGVTAPSVDIPADAAEVAISLTAAPDAPRASQTFQLVVEESGSGTAHPVNATLTSGGEDNGVPNGFPKLLVGSTSWLWLTVVPAPPAPPPQPPAPAEVPPPKP